MDKGNERRVQKRDDCGHENAARQVFQLVVQHVESLQLDATLDMGKGMVVNQESRRA